MVASALQRWMQPYPTVTESVVPVHEMSAPHLSEPRDK